MLILLDDNSTKKSVIKQFAHYKISDTVYFYHPTDANRKGVKVKDQCLLFSKEVVSKDHIDLTTNESYNRSYSPVLYILDSQGKLIYFNTDDMDRPANDAMDIETPLKLMLKSLNNFLKFISYFCTQTEQELKEANSLLILCPEK